MERHAQEAAKLLAARMTLVAAPQVKLDHLQRADARLAAHLDGLAVAGDKAWAISGAALETPTAGDVFNAAVRVIDGRRQDLLERLLLLAKASPAGCRGLLSALGWLEGAQLRGVVVDLIDSTDPFRRAVGIAACAMHRVDPDIVAKGFLQDPDVAVRARAFRAAGELGLHELAPTCAAAAAATGEDPEVKFWAAWSSVLLGHRQTAVMALLDTWRSATTHRERAFRLALQAVSSSAAHAMLQTLANDAKDRRWLIQGCGIAGDAAYLPWLVKQMHEVTTARIAGEAFALITGADLSTETLDRPAHDGVDFGPTDEPGDPNVAMDQDDGLPWPDADRVQQWWDRNAEQFPRGVRYFMGAPATRERCLDVLQNGYQRQRILAAHHLCLLEPGTPLFNTSAPASRQQRWLAKLA